MHTILIAHHDVDFAEELAAELRGGGIFAIVTCPGPFPPQRCIQCDTGYCPLSDGAHLMIYDPVLTSLDAEGNSHYLAVDSALAHPDIPLLLAWSPDAVPDAGTLRAIHDAAPWVHVASHDRAKLLRQVHELLLAQAHPLEVIT
jgi:hypothetical protein